MSGLKPGDKVRIAGVPVGSVEKVSIDDDNLAEVEFTVDTKYSLFDGTKATVRYENLVGDRYMELLEGAGSVEPLPDGGSIPVENTSPALDLDLLLGGFKPLLRALDPAAGQRPVRGPASRCSRGRAERSSRSSAARVRSRTPWPTGTS